jgi:uncharacterized protein (DUF2249 family)
MDRVLDVSALPPPEPLERVLDALSDLQSGDRLVVRLRRQPFPLYDILSHLGYRWDIEGVEGDWRILIAAQADRGQPTGP